MNQNVIKLFLLFHFLHILYCKKPFENYLYICKTTLYFLNELFDNFERSNRSTPLDSTIIEFKFIL